MTVVCYISSILVEFLPWSFLKQVRHPCIEFDLRALHSEQKFVLHFVDLRPVKPKILFDQDKQTDLAQQCHFHTYKLQSVIDLYIAVKI